MNIISRKNLKKLGKKRDGWHVSIFVPTHQAGSEIQQDPIRLKNLVREAEQHLNDAGLRSPEAEELLEPALSLVQDRNFWQIQSDGLAIFLSSEIADHYRLPLDFQELVVVADRFHLKPLLPLLSGDGQFFILALSQDEVRLLLGTRYKVGEVDLAGTPTSFAEALRLDDPEKQLQFHTATGPAGGRGGRAASFHGHGGATKDDKVDLLRYFHKVDEGVQNLLAGEKAPLVLAGVDYLLPLYREANTYAHLIEEGIEGNPDDLSMEELHQDAWVLVESHFLEERDAAADRFRQLASTDSASDDLAEIVPAAHHGRVETLFVSLDHQQWGAYDPETNEIRLRRELKPGDQDLMDFAAVQVLLHGGSVYAAEAEQLPVGAPLAALFRY
jgi:hypothetical protein